MTEQKIDCLKHFVRWGAIWGLSPVQRFKMFIMEIHCARWMQAKSNGSMRLHSYCFMGEFSPLEKNPLGLCRGERGARTGEEERTPELVRVTWQNQTPAVFSPLYSSHYSTTSNPSRLEEDKYVLMGYIIHSGLLLENSVIRFLTIH